MVADGLVTQGARASATMILTYFSQNILVLVPDGGTLLLFLSVNYVKVFFTDVQILSNTRNINPFAKLFSRNIKSYYHFLSTLNLTMAQVVENFPHIRKDPHILDSKYCGCWWPGKRSKGLSNHDTDSALIQYDVLPV